jgi:hypothetical protein
MKKDKKIDFFQNELCFKKYFDCIATLMLKTLFCNTLRDSRLKFISISGVNKYF